MKHVDEFKSKIFAAMSEFEYSTSKLDDKTRELIDTCARLAAKNAELEEKVEELSDVVSKLVAKAESCCPPKEGEKQIIHG